MSSFLLDTNVVSEWRKPRPNPKVIAWFQPVHTSDLYVSVIVLGELRKGIELVRAKDPSQAKILEQWLLKIEASFARILPITQQIADRWGRLAAQRPRSITDGLVAATALVHNFIIVTRNISDFADTGAALIDPFQ